MASSRFATVTQEEIEKYRENSVMILFLILKNTIIRRGKYSPIFTETEVNNYHILYYIVDSEMLKTTQQDIFHIFTGGDIDYVIISPQSHCVYFVCESYEG